FPHWPLWSELIGIQTRRNINTHFNQQIPIEVVDTNHPITQGVSNWTLTDETYEMNSPRPEDGNQLLLTTSYQPSMSGIAWTRTFGKSRVFCYQSGHDSDTFQDYSTLSTRGNNSLLNTSSRVLTNDAEDKIFNINAFLTKKLKKKGRTLSLNLSQSVTDNKTDGYLNSANSFYNLNGVLDSITNVNQYKVNSIKNNVFKSNLAYTEPLSKTLTVVLNYGLTLSNGRSDRKSFNQSLPGRYDVLDTEFSNDYQLDQIINSGGAIFNYKKGKSVLNVGSKFSGVNFKQEDLYNQVRYDRKFVNYMPQAMYQYNFSQQKSFRINYNGNTQQPNLEQIQPIRVNTDPLNITLGNPDLRPSFRSSLNASYNSYKVLSSQSIYISGYYSFTNNPIVSN
ncbi:MAG: hypothetical protein EOO43_22330, partial [Flavobacterium sp.]